MFDVAIVGGGPAGMGAAITAATEGLDVAVLERSDKFGGQSKASPLIENYPGFPHGVSGMELAMGMQVQAKRMGAKLVPRFEVTEFYQQEDDGGTYFRILGKDPQVAGSERVVEAKSVVLALGLQYRRLSDTGDLPIYYPGDDIEGVENQCCLVVGAGNGAAQAALEIARQADSVVLLCRGDSLHKSMSQYLIKRIERDPHIVVMTNAELVKSGENYAVVDQAGEVRSIPCVEGYAFIGATPATEWMAKYPIQRNENGYVIPKYQENLSGTRLPNATDVSGVFVCGDVRGGAVNRIVSAAADGAGTVGLVLKWLGER